MCSPYLLFLREHGGRNVGICFTEATGIMEEI